MKHPDYDRAFHQTPDYIRSAIELGFLKGQRRTKLRRRFASALTAAAVFVVLLGAGAYGVFRLAANRPDDRADSVSLTAQGQNGRAGSLPLSARGQTDAPPQPAPTRTNDAEARSAEDGRQVATSTPSPQASIASTSSPRATEEAAVTSTARAPLSIAELSPTPAPIEFDYVVEEDEGALLPEEEAIPEPTPTLEAPTPGIDPTPAPIEYDTVEEEDEGALSLAEEATPEPTPTPGIDPTPAPTAFDSLVEAAMPTPAPEKQLVYLYVYADEGADPYFHLDEHCGGIEEFPEELDVAYALWQGLTPCPRCVDGSGYRPLVFRADGSGDVAIRDGLWYTEFGSYFHVDANCSGMAGAQKRDIVEAFGSGKRSCPVCMQNWACALALDEPGSELALAYALGDAQTEDLPAPTPTPEIASAAEAAPATEVSLAEVYYAEAGRYFHARSDCATLLDEKDDNGAIAGGLMDALRAGKDACPDCLSGWDFVVSAVPAEEQIVEHDDAEEGWSYAAVRAETIEEEISTVYAAASGAEYYHRSDACGGEALPRGMSVERALTEGLAACPDCLPADECRLIAYYEADGSQVSAEALWYTEGGRYFHSSMYCGDMRGAEIHPIAEAFASGKAACPDCMAGWVFALRRVVQAGAPGSASYEIAADAPAAEYAAASDEGGLLAVTDAGEEAVETEAAIAVSSPDGAPYDISHKFYYTPGGSYYHMRRECSGMRGAERHDAAETAASGKRHCPLCIGDRASYYWLPVPREDGNYDVPKLYFAETDSWQLAIWSDAGKVFVPLGAEGAQPRYYHVNPECFGMGAARMIPWGEAKEAGYVACPACLTALNPGGSRESCYICDGDALYHLDPACSGLKAARPAVRIEAQAEGRLRCPLCAGEDAPADWEQIRGDLGAALASAYPGWVFERADELGDCVEWFISNGEEAMRAVTFRFDGENVAELVLEHGGSDTAYFEREFIDMLPAPLDTIGRMADAGRIYRLALQYDGGELAGYEVNGGGQNEPVWRADLHSFENSGNNDSVMRTTAG